MGKVRLLFGLNDNRIGAQKPKKENGVPVSSLAKELEISNPNADL